MAKRWQAFNFDAEVKVKFDPFNYQQMAGLTNFYNDKHWSFAFVTWNEKNGRVIEVAECNRGGYRSFLRDDAIPVPDDVEFVWLRTKVRKQSYSYEYSFDGKNYTEIPGTLDAAVLSVITYSSHTVDSSPEHLSAWHAWTTPDTIRQQNSAVLTIKNWINQ